MQSQNSSKLLDSIYTSAWDPGALDDALEGLARACRSRSAGVFRVTAGALDWGHVYNVPEEFMPAFARVAPQDPRIAHGVAQPALTLLRDDLPALRREMQAAGIDALVREYDLPYTVSCSLNPPGDDGAVALFISRSSREGTPGSTQLKAFRRYAPHFARAFSLRQRMRCDLLAGARSLTPGGEPQQGALAMDRRGRVRWLDGCAEYLLNQSDGIELRGGRLSFADAVVARHFSGALQGLISGRPHADPKAVCVPQTRPPGTLTLRLLPGSSAAENATQAPITVTLRSVVHAAPDTRPTPTPRQLEVLQLLAQGLPSKLIGARLEIAENTVRNHIQHLLRLLGVTNRSACAARARDCGWLD